jgi:hypothetical protein
MINKSVYYIIGVVLVIGLSSASINYYAPLHAKLGPTGYTGATGSYCNSQCHTTYALNMTGGAMSISGLPSTYSASTKYTFSLLIKHSAVDRKKFGFAVIAVNSAGTAVGTFSTTNAYATTNGSELVSSNPPALTTATNSYTFDNLSWTAPSTTTGSNSSITFYYVGNAANNNMSTSGDYVYAGSVKMTPAGSSNLPLQMIDFTAGGQGAAVVLRWSTTQEQNTGYFGVERSDDGLYYTEQGHVKAAGNSDLLRKYVFTDSLKGTTPSQLFYRIVTVDLDGRKTYSPVRTVSLETTRTYIRNYFPNPVQAGKEVQLELVSHRTGQADIQLFGAEGMLLSQQKAELIKGINQIAVSVPYSVMPGRITAVITAGGQVLQVPVLVNRQ